MREINWNAAECATLCWVWQVTLSDGTQLGFTDHDRPLDFMGLTCAPRSGFTPGETDGRIGYASDTGSVQGVLEGDIISADDIQAGRFGRGAD